MPRDRVGSARRWVIKVGSSLVTARGQGLDRPALSQWGEQIARLREAQCEVVLVSSGAVAEGMARLGWRRRPHAIHDLQAAAAVGQMGLVQAYEECFNRHGLRAAQVLLTHDDLADRRRYLNARSTLRSLLALGVIPVVNENDTVASNELRFGDNDTLAAMVANLIEADLLVILTDQPGLYDRNPSLYPDARLIGEGRASDPQLRAVAGPSEGQLGRGGMITKIEAARRAAGSGAMTLIVGGHDPRVIDRVRAGEALGTLLVPDTEPRLARKQWLANQLKVKGVLVLDAGACRVLRERGSSLLAVGVTEVRGSFHRGDMVSCVNAEDREVARGLVNYSAAEARMLQGKPSSAIESILGYVDEPELVNRDNMVVVA